MAGLRLNMNNLAPNTNHPRQKDLSFEVRNRTYAARLPKYITMKTRKKKIIKIILLSIFIVVANLAPGQNEAIEIEFLGNCGLFMTDGNLKVYVDFPYKSGAYGYMTYRPGLVDSIHENSIFIFTHGHAEHFNRKGFKQTNQKLYGPWPVSFFLSGKRKYKFFELNDKGQNFSITKFKTKHRLSLKHYSYLIEWNNKRIYISGDDESADTISTLDDLDLAFAPYWLLHNASERGIKIQTKQIILYHHPSVESIDNKSEKVIVPVQYQKFELE